jgi:hypothetical protein
MNIKIYLTGKQPQFDRLELSQWKGKMIFLVFFEARNREIVKIEISAMLSPLILSF